ncbi:ABC transporter permease [Candidatus Woesearchaeota archaeon]|nr:ABC transporter permease [Candidatus Woesearchaeota archaeon]MCF7901547.1 ABC transporter permease [Candidatus Woesearchaeota archaeon]
MKEYKVFIKNLKILARSKGSALVILLAPLLIVLIIGAGLYDTTETKMTIGVYVPGNGDLEARYISNLNNSDNQIITYTSKESCISGIETNTILSCIIFPDNFKLEDETKKILEIHVDESRMNLVYKIISSLTNNFDIENEEISHELTTQILSILSRTNLRNQENINNLNMLKTELSTNLQTAESSNKALNEVNDEDEDVDLLTISSNFGKIEDDFDSLRKNARNIITSGYALLDATTYNGSEITDLKNALSDINNTYDDTRSTDELMKSFSKKLNSASLKVESLRDKLKESKTVRLETITKFDSLIKSIKKHIETSNSLIEKMDLIKKDISSFKLKDADSIVRPVDTNIIPVSTHNKVTYSFPYLLMMIILFVGLMLSAMLVFMEKDSKAFFRNFTTPLKDSFFRNMTFLTSLIILCIQTSLILIIVNLILDVPILSNVWMTSLIMFLSITFFIILGMVLGYVFNSSEGIMMSSIALGAIMIFFSNLILPIETLAPTIQKIVSFNPYVLTSELLKKSILFNAPFSDLQFQLGTLFVYIIIVLILLITITKTNSPMYKLQKAKKTKDITIPVDKYLYIAEKNIVVRDLVTLLDAIRSLSDKEYQDVEIKNKTFSNWLFSIYKDKSLRRKLKNKSKRKAILVLLNYLNS